LRILFFAPYSAVWNHAFPEALVAEALKQGGHEIVYLGCGGLLSSHCVSMSGCSVPFTASKQAKDRVCGICKGNLKIIRKRFGFGGPDLLSLANDGDLAAAEELMESTLPESRVDLVVDGVEVGRIALYEMVVQSKRGTLDFNSTERLRYRASLVNVIVALRVVKRLFDELSPDRIILYNALYSVNRAVCRLAEIRGIPQYYLHAGDNLSNRLQTLVLARDHAFSYYAHLRRQWQRYKERPCPLRAMQAGTNHLLEVARGRSLWAYSSASGGNADLRKKFGIGAGQKVICATMSSDDERFGGEIAGVLPSLGNLLFPKQIDWIRALIDYVAARNELFLVIRVHPREFPNKRERVLSEHARTLQEAFARLPANVVVNWPTDEVSLYDLATVTDVFANAWSSAGREMAWLGLPVVLYAEELTLYPSDLNYVGTTRTEYFRKIQQALADGWSAAWIRNTYRWCAVELSLSSLDISESFAKNEHARFLSRGFSKLLRTVAPTFEQEKDCHARADSLSASPTINRIIAGELNAAIDLEDAAPTVTYAEETVFLKREVRRLVDGLYGAAQGGHENPLAGRLRDFANSQSVEAAGGVARSEERVS
jgi:hypothetical protein